MSGASTAARQKWSRIIEAQRASGLTVARFCAERGLAPSSFYPWKRRLGPAARAPGSTPGTPVFVEAKVAAEPRHGERGVTIVVAGGRRIIVGPGFDRMLLLEVIDALESGAGPGVGPGAAGGDDRDDARAVASCMGPAGAASCVGPAGAASCVGASGVASCVGPAGAAAGGGPS